MKAMLVAALCTLALLGCKPDPALSSAPVVRGELVVPGAGRMPLAQSQVAACVEWIKEQRWGKLRNTPPSPVQSIVFNHSDGARTYVEFYTGRPGWGNTLLIRGYDKDGQLQFTGVDDFDESDLLRLTANLPR